MVFASSICFFKTPAITVAPRCFAVNTAERPTFPRAPTTKTVWPDLISVAERSWLPVVVTSGNAAAWIKSRPLGTFAKTAAFTTQSSALIFVCHRDHLVADEKAPPPRPNLDDGPRHIDAYQPWELHGVKILG